MKKQNPMKNEAFECAIIVNVVVCALHTIKSLR